jgi:hypothetical protein
VLQICTINVLKSLSGHQVITLGFIALGSSLSLRIVARLLLNLSSY